MGVRSIFDDLFRLFRKMVVLNQCECGSDDIAIDEHYTSGVYDYAIIKCKKCNREIKRKSLKKAEKAWNKNNPKKEGIDNDL